MNVKLIVLAAAVLVVIVPAWGWAQTVSSTTGTIIGRVTDGSDAVLPGVTVTASGPALMGVRTAVTDQNGSYRFPALPPGEYRLTFELGGFSMVVREQLQLALGFTATVNVAMQLASLKESVTVLGASPVVDTQSTRVQTNYTAERLESLPNARDIWSIMAASPSVRQAVVDVGGSSAGSQSQFVTYGTRAQNQPMIEGMLMSQIGTAGGSVTFYYDYGSFAEVSVNAAGNSADMAMPGVQFQYISKSGGNDFHGGGLADYQNEKIQSFNIDADQIARGASSKTDNRLNSYYDRNVDIGGPVMKDRLWWYTSVRDQKMQVRYPNFPVGPFQTRLTNITGKGTYQLSTNNKLIVYGQAGKKLQPNRLGTATIGGPGGSRSFAIHESADSTEGQDYLGWVYKGEYNRVISNAAFAEIRAGQVGYYWITSGYSDDPRREDIGNLKVTGGNSRWRSDVARNQLLGSLSLFKTDWAGTHSFKIGFELYRDVQTRDEKGYPGNLLHVFNNTAPIEVRQYIPSISDSRLFAGGAYITDTWSAGRLTLNLGVRIDRYRGYLPAQSRPASQFAQAAEFAAIDRVMSWYLPAPRAGFAYQLTKDAKTVLKMNAGRYWWNPDVNVASSVNSNIATGYERYTWADRNGDRVWQPGEQGNLIARVGGAGLRLDPNLKDSYTDELASWLDHELLPNFGLRTGFVWRGQRQLRQTRNVLRPFSAFTVPVQVRDPGADGRLNTSDDGASLTLYNLAPEFVGRVQNLVMNVGEKNDYYTWELTANRRMVDRWSLMASYSFTWNRENLGSPGAAANPVRAADSPLSPNDMLHTSDGRYHHTLWNVKLHTVLDGPWNLRFSPLVRSQAGQAFGRTFVAALNYGSQRVLAEPLGTQRQDTVTIVDARVERVFRLRRSIRMSTRLDLYNLLNSNAEDFITWASGASYLYPNSIVPPRIVRFGVKVDW